MTPSNHHVPVRSIGVQSRSVSGTVPLFGQYESSLERDLMEILRFDPNIEHFIPQPLTITFVDKYGVKRSYTPDGLIHFKSIAGLPPASTLFEVKYREDFRKNWKTLIPKFRAAKAHCRENGWRFEVFTEQEIRTPYLDNVRFLWPYRERKPSHEMLNHILETLWDLDEADPNLLLCALCHDQTNRAHLIPILWHLVAIGTIGCDLDMPLTMHSRIWAKKDC